LSTHVNPFQPPKAYAVGLNLKESKNNKCHQFRSSSKEMESARIIWNHEK
jgi:hypothetical protein